MSEKGTNEALQALIKVYNVIDPYYTYMAVKYDIMCLNNNFKPDAKIRELDIRKMTASYKLFLHITSNPN